MFLQSKACASSVSYCWLLARGWRRLGVLAFLGCACLLSGCGASATNAGATLTHPQPTPAVAHPFHTTIQTFDGAFAITLDITPNRSGPNQFRAQVIDDRAHKPATHILITLYTTMQDMPMGTDSVV